MFKPHFQRLDIIGETYFITTKTNDNVHYFIDYGACRILLENIRIAKILLNFELYAFIIMPDHLHLLICPKGSKGIGKIMQFIKRNTSRHINDKLKNIPNLGAPVTKAEPVAKIDKSWLPDRFALLNNHIEKINSININPDKYSDMFKWQASFYDRRMRNEFEFQTTLDYINEKNLADLIYKYKILTDENAKDYPFYSFTNPELIDPY